MDKPGFVAEIPVQMMAEASFYVPDRPPVLDSLVDESYYDVTLVCGEGAVKAHRLVLSCASDFLKCLFEDSSESSTILLPDVNLSYLKMVLEFLYKGSVSLHEKDISALNGVLDMLAITCHSTCYQCFQEESVAKVVSIDIQPDVAGGAESVPQELTYVLQWDGKTALDSSESDGDNGVREEPLLPDVCEENGPAPEEVVVIVQKEFAEEKKGKGSSPIKCEFCRRQFITTAHLQAHVETRHTFQHMCTICSKMFTSVTALKQHQKNHKQATKEETEEEKEEEIAPPAPVPSTKLQSVRERKRRVRQVANKSFSCDGCSKTFFTRWDLERHRRAHTGERPFNCHFCDKAFRRKEYCDRHERLHTGNKAFSCRVCEKMFSAKAHCEQHEMTHTGEKPYSCQTCGQMFARKSNLREHEQAHEGNKPFECGLCGKGFARRGQCKGHEMSHTGEKHHTCRFCAKGFISKKGWAIHERMHASKHFLCCYCGKGFRIQKECRLHEKTHTGEKPFSCRFCSKVFKYERWRIMHEERKHKEKAGDLKN